MEVILKKAKITSSILNQTIYARPQLMGNWDVIGWCIHKERRYIIFYDKESNTLKKFDSYERIEFISDLEINRFEVEIIRYNRDESISLRCSTLEEQNELAILLESVRIEALEKGQFYI
jgi:hypothetical protein